VQHFMNTLTNPFALMLRDGATTSRLLRMTGKGRRPLALREGSPVSSPAFAHPRVVLLFVGRQP